MKKKILSMLLATTMFGSSLHASVSAVTMYAADGRTSAVMDSDVEAWKAVGWYDVPVSTMYAPDGRTTVVATSEIPAWKAVGWYDVPVSTLYATEGRIAVVATSDVAAWKAVGWYDVPVSTMYAPDGRTTVIAASEIPTWKADGWYEHPPVFINLIEGYGDNLQTLKNKYSDLTSMEWLGTNYGLDWYQLTNKIKVGFEGISVINNEHTNDSGGRCIAVLLPVWEAYPELYEVGGDDQILSKIEFEAFTGTAFELNSSYFSIYSSPYLSYKQNNYEIVVLCDENGNVNVSHYERSYCFMYKR